MQDVSSGKLAGYSGTITITDTTPATITTKSLTQAVQTLATATTYTITYTAINKMAAAGGAFKITYPSTVTPGASMTTCNVIYNSVTYPMSTCTVDTTAKTITISNGFTSTVAAGDQIQVQFGPITNPSTQNGATASFSILSYTSSALTYTID